MISEAKEQINEEIIKYRTQANIAELMDIFNKKCMFLLTLSSYNIGYMEGLGKSLKEYSSDLSEKINSSYFKDIWNALFKTLKEMHSIYPAGWKGYNIFDNLADVVESYYGVMGFLFENTKQDPVYISIPYRAESMPI